MTIPSGTDISDFLHGADGLGWLLLVVALGYGGYRLQRTLRVPQIRPDRVSPPSHAPKPDRATILGLYCCGAFLVSSAIPCWRLMARDESAPFFNQIGLTIVALGAATIAAAILLGARNRAR